MIYKKQLLSFSFLFSILSNNIHADGEQTPVVITEANFEQEVIKSKFPVIFYAYDSDNALHLTVLSLFAELCLEHEFAGKLKFATMNINQEQDLAHQLHVEQGMLLLFYKGIEEGDEDNLSVCTNKEHLRALSLDCLKITD